MQEHWLFYSLATVTIWRSTNCFIQKRRIFYAGVWIFIQEHLLFYIRVPITLCRSTDYFIQELRLFYTGALRMRWSQNYCQNNKWQLKSWQELKQTVDCRHSSNLNPFSSHDTSDNRTTVLPSVLHYFTKAHHGVPSFTIPNIMRFEVLRVRNIKSVFGMWRHVVWLQRTNVSEEHSTSIICPQFGDIRFYEASILFNMLHGVM
jgi:hypothetical protein